MSVKILQKTAVAVCCVLATFLVAAATSPVAKSYFQRTHLEYIAPGVRYYHFLEPESPANVDAVRINRSEKFISLTPVMGGNTLFGVEPLSRMVMTTQTESGYPVAAVNGDFYKLGKYEGMTTGLMIIDGELVTTPVTTGKKPDKPSFAIYKNGQPDILYIYYTGTISVPGAAHYELYGVNRPRKSGGFILYTPRFGATTPPEEGATDIVLKNIQGPEKSGRWRLRENARYTAYVASLKYGGGAAIPKDSAVLSILGQSSGVATNLKPGSKVRFSFERQGGRHEVESAIGGWPIIVENGQNLHEPGKSPRHPRTVLGYNDSEIFMVVVDGRRAGWSVGMNFHELGELLLRMKCKEAINLDGGGSSTMWVRGELKNKVSDGKERSISNGFTVVSSAPRIGRLQQLAIDPSELSVLASYTLKLKASGTDKYYNPIGLGGSPKWRADGNVGTISSDGTFTSASSTTVGTVSVSLGPIVKSMEVEVYNEPPIFQIFPTAVNLFNGETIQFRYHAMDHKGIPVMGDYESRIAWRVTPGMGQIDSRGNFTASQTSAMRGEITVRIGDIDRRAKVTVGTIPRIIDDFEGNFVWSDETYPDASVAGSFSAVKTNPRSGMRCGRLRYRFGTKNDTEAVYAKSTFQLRSPMAVRIYIKGNGSSHDLRLAYRNVHGGRETVEFEQGSLYNTQWHTAVARIPLDEYFPITFESIYVLKNIDDTAHMSGEIFIDDFTAMYAPE